MDPTSTRTGLLPLILMALPALLGSFAVLVLAEVGRGIWISHILAMFLATGLALIGLLLRRRGRGHGMALFWMIIALGFLTLTLFGLGTGPRRWLVLGPWSIYLAPLVLPALMVSIPVGPGVGRVRPWYALGSLVGATALLAAQPDLSQVLAMGAMAGIFLWKKRLGLVPVVLILVSMALMTLWAWAQPDPLLPVSYVEGVFALGLSHSWLMGLVFLAAALILVLGLWVQGLRGHPGLMGLAGYYAVMFGCSIAGITPVPLLGYGAGPLLGYGLMLGVLASQESGEHTDGAGPPGHKIASKHQG